MKHSCVLVSNITETVLLRYFIDPKIKDSLKQKTVQEPQP